MKEGWSYKKVGDVSNVYAGQGAPQGESNYSDIGIPFVKAGNLGELTTGTHESEIQKVSPEVASSHGLKLYKKGSVLFAKSGMSCMKGYIYTLKTDCYVVSHLAILEPQNIDSKYLHFYLRYKKPYSLVKDEAYPSISLKDIENMPIIIPNNKAQEGLVVTELDNIDKLINHKKSQLKDLDLLTQSLFFEMFGDPIENEKGWEQKKIGEVCAEKKNIRRASKCFDGSDDIQYVDISSINNTSNCIIGTTAFSFDEAPSRAQQKVEKGDILISLVRPNLKNIAIVDIDEDNLVASSGFCVLRATKSSNYFIKTLVLTPHFTEYLVKRVTGANYPAVREDDIRNCSIGVPPLTLQQTFSERIDVIEKQKEQIISTIKDLETLLASRMQYWFD